VIGRASLGRDEPHVDCEATTAAARAPARPPRPRAARPLDDPASARVAELERDQPRARPVLAEGLAQRLEVGLRIAGRPIGAGLVEQRLGAQEAGIGPKSHDLPLMWKPLASWPSASGPKGGPGRARHDDAALGRAHLEEAIAKKADPPKPDGET
jgi:hypothetical protein